MSVVLVTGAFGQIGTELVPALLDEDPTRVVVVLAHHKTDAEWPSSSRVVVEKGDVRDGVLLARLVNQYRFEAVYHLAGILSATGERDVGLCWSVNVESLRVLLDIAATQATGMRIFWASSIAVFGPSTPKIAPQTGPFSPDTIYGVGKVAGELLAEYYAKKRGVDIRALRYPGLISSKQEPGGGTTDYSCAIFKEAVTSNSYTCFVRDDTRLPLLSMSDAVRATLQLMKCESLQLTVRTYNIGGFSCRADEMAAEIRSLLPHFTMRYDVDPLRQGIADSWPDDVDDTVARRDWQWEPQNTLPVLTRQMIADWQNKTKKP